MKLTYDDWKKKLTQCFFDYHWYIDEEFIDSFRESYEDGNSPEETASEEVSRGT